MIAKKLFSFVIAAFMVFAFSSNAFAEFFSVSVGIPVSYAFAGDDNIDLETDGMPSGAVLHVKFPIMVGVGYETYVVKLKDLEGGATDVTVTTNMYDIFYLFPIPVINFTLGIGMGTSTLDCTYSGGTCADDVETAPAMQWWGQLGFPVFPFLDVHASYHAITAKAEGKGTGDSDVDLSGTMMALGVSFIF